MALNNMIKWNSNLMMFLNKKIINIRVNKINCIKIINIDKKVLRYIIKIK